MAKPAYRLKGTEGRPWCDKHPPLVLLCWCGYARADVALNAEPESLVPFAGEPQPVQETAFQQALREGAANARS